jgi:hypothetical protein
MHLCKWNGNLNGQILPVTDPLTGCAMADLMTPVSLLAFLRFLYIGHTNLNRVFTPAKPYSFYISLRGQSWMLSIWVVPPGCGSPWFWWSGD